MSWSDASGRKELESKLRRFGSGSDSAINLAEAALLIAALDTPKAPIEVYQDHLRELARDTAEQAVALNCESSLEERITALRNTLVERHGYGGDQETYDDLQNANLMRVIDRRKGLPIALGILYMHCARSQGWTVSGLNFPGHFMLRFDLGSERAIVDPFNEARMRDTAELRNILKAFAGNEAELKPEHYTPMLNRDILIRLLNNMKLRLMQDKRVNQAVEMIETMLMIAPERAGIWHDAGSLHARVGNLRAAIIAFEQYMDLSHESDIKTQTADLLAELKARLN